MDKGVENSPLRLARIASENEICALDKEAGNSSLWLASENENSLDKEANHTFTLRKIFIRRGIEK